MWLYSLLLLISVAVPIALSFDKQLQFYKQWKFVLPSITIVAVFYIVFDILFTHLGIWSFNYRYNLGLYILNLPIEEWLFFFAIPYASVFLHFAFVYHLPKFKLNIQWSNYLTLTFIVVLIILLIYNWHKIYTVYSITLLLLAFVLALLDKKHVIAGYYITFIIIAIPFIIVNGILTGTFIEQPVIWYNNNEITNWRIFTIPVEDFGYAFSIILFNLLLINKLKIKWA